MEKITNILLVILFIIASVSMWQCNKMKDELMDNKAQIDSIHNERKILKEKTDSVEALRFNLLQQIIQTDSIRKTISERIAENKKTFIYEKNRVSHLPIDSLVSFMRTILSDKDSL